jgi:hypothetical protein
MDGPRRHTFESLMRSQIKGSGLLRYVGLGVAWIAGCALSGQGSPQQAPVQAPVAAPAPAPAAPATRLASPAPATVEAPPAAPSKPAPIMPPTGAVTQGVAQIQEVLETLARFDQNGRPAGQKISFEIPERAVNEYLAYALRNRPRPGIAGASVTMGARNEVEAAVEVDFDAVQQWSPDLVPEPLRPLLHGKSAVRISAQFQSGNGEVTVTVKQALMPDGSALPGPVAAGLVRAIGQHQPEKYDTSKPITLPFGLKRLWIEKRTVCGETT